MSFISKPKHDYTINYNGDIITITGISPDDEQTIRDIAYNNHAKIRDTFRFMEILSARFPDAVIDTFIKGDN